MVLPSHNSILHSITSLLTSLYLYHTLDFMLIFLSQAESVKLTMAWYFKCRGTPYQKLVHPPSAYIGEEEIENTFLP